MIPWITHYRMPARIIDGVLARDLSLIRHPSGATWIEPHYSTLVEHDSYVWARRPWTRTVCAKWDKLRRWWNTL